MKTIKSTGNRASVTIKLLMLFAFSPVKCKAILQAKLFHRVNFFLFTFSLFIASLQAQSPEKMSYQAVVRDASDDLVVSSTIGMQVSILQGSAGGTAVYVETHTPATNANGLVTIEVGAGSVVSGDFTTIDWSNGPYFLKIETDPAGGTNYTITGTSQLLSVPYALHAKTADSANVFNGDMQNQNITNLADPVYGQDAATKAYVDAIIDQLYDQGAIQVRDNDGNYYHTVKIGDQLWMAENLKTTNYNDGTAIPLVSDSATWSNLTIEEAYCSYNNSAFYEDIYGNLYNWYAVNTGKLCPTGWHVPSDAEWTVLTDYLGGSSVAGGKMKETGTAHWASPNTGATNESGFSGLPGGDRLDDGAFDFGGSFGDFWSSTEYNATYAWDRYLIYDDAYVNRDYYNKKSGFSVRCLRD